MYDYQSLICIGYYLYYRTVEPRYGRVSFFTSGVGNKHHVEPVTEGTRYALTMGFSCNPK